MHEICGIDQWVRVKRTRKCLICRKPSNIYYPARFCYFCEECSPIKSQKEMTP